MRKAKARKAASPRCSGTISPSWKNPRPVISPPGGNWILAAGRPPRPRPAPAPVSETGGGPGAVCPPDRPQLKGIGAEWDGLLPPALLKFDLRALSCNGIGVAFVDASGMRIIGAQWQLMITARAGQFHGAPPHHHSGNQLIEFTTEQD